MHAAIPHRARTAQQPRSIPRARGNGALLVSTPVYPSAERRLGASEHRAAPGAPTRTESDSLGTVEVPADAYWGVHTMRALENFPISKRPISVYPELVIALASVKQAAARANRELGVLTQQKAAWIDEACQRVIDGELHDQFVVGVIQGGAGTSTNMNANEVITNLALEIGGLLQGPLRRAAPHRRREPQPVDQRHLSDRGEARDGLLAAHHALRARPAAHRLRTKGPRVQRRPEGRSHAVAGRRADDARAGVPQLRHHARRRRRPPARDHQAAVRGEPRRHGDRHGHHGGARLHGGRGRAPQRASRACGSSRRPTSSRRRATPACS